MNLRKNKSLRSEKGFTLIEVMVVIIILGLLAAVVAPKFFKNVDKAKWKTAKIQIEAFGTALDNFRLDNDRYPNDEEGLKILWEKPEDESLPGWNGPYLPKAVNEDPWGHAYIYKSPGEHGEYDIVSLGKDGEEGGEDYNKDVTSWE